MRRVGRAFAAIAGIAFGCAAYLYVTLPDVRTLRTSNPTRTAFMDLRDREARAKREVPRHAQRWVSYANISPQLKRAVLVAEDSAFWQHDGIDYEQLKESIEVNLERGEFVRGASTITQQLAKNLYLSPSKNPVRKLQEFVIARRLETELSKQRILELYLNLIEWGDGIWGAEAAARTVLPQVCRRSERARVCAAGCSDREPACAHARTSDGAASAAAANDPGTNGRSDTAARDRRRRRDAARCRRCHTGSVAAAGALAGGSPWHAGGP